MAKKDKGEIATGVVTEALPNAMFRVLLDRPVGIPAPVTDPTASEETPMMDTEDQPEVPEVPVVEMERQTIIAYLAGKMKYFRIKVIVGDKVEVLIDPYGGKGRLVKRK
ncbi:MAG: translation initiation factor IF-1 [Planctomycetota bacterium]|jgi:translation initiation factor IF-1